MRWFGCQGALLWRHLIEPVHVGALRHPLAPGRLLLFLGPPTGHVVDHIPRRDLQHKVVGHQPLGAPGLLVGHVDLRPVRAQRGGEVALGQSLEVAHGRRLHRQLLGRWDHALQHREAVLPQHSQDLVHQLLPLCTPRSVPCTAVHRVASRERACRWTIHVQAGWRDGVINTSILIGKWLNLSTNWMVRMTRWRHRDRIPIETAKSTRASPPSWHGLPKLHKVSLPLDVPLPLGPSHQRPKEKQPRRPGAPAPHGTETERRERGNGGERRHRLKGPQSS
mmetsp:Transcript_121389/g.288419  ORF Transcript_121389/g.288419 Transcript_121389/m.288419 type:complete len:279 (-) Transcript_121389:9-845(-)